MQKVIYLEYKMYNYFTSLIQNAFLVYGKYK